MYLVLFQGIGAPTPGDVLTAVAGPDVEVTHVAEADSAYGRAHFAVPDTLLGTVTEVYCCDEDYVLQGSWEIAEQFATDRHDREYIAGCDRRFEVMAKVDDQVLYFTNWLITAERLQALVGGGVFDPTTATFLD